MPISEKDISEARHAWGEGLIEISKILGVKNTSEKFVRSTLVSSTTRGDRRRERERERKSI